MSKIIITMILNWRNFKNVFKLSTNLGTKYSAKIKSSITLGIIKESLFIFGDKAKVTEIELPENKSSVILIGDE
jgi:hypothetical protein